MSKDIDEMENMLNDYLQFSKTQAQESTTKVNLKNLLDEIKKNLNNKNLKILDSKIVNLKEDLWL